MPDDADFRSLGVLSWSPRRMKIGEFRMSFIFRFVCSDILKRAAVDCLQSKSCAIGERAIGNEHGLYPPLDSVPSLIRLVAPSSYFFDCAVWCRRSMFLRHNR